VQHLEANVISICGARVVGAPGWWRGWYAAMVVWLAAEGEVAPGLDGYLHVSNMWWASAGHGLEVAAVQHDD